MIERYGTLKINHLVLFLYSTSKWNDESYNLTKKNTIVPTKCDYIEFREQWIRLKALIASHISSFINMNMYYI